MDRGMERGMEPPQDDLGDEEEGDFEGGEEVEEEDNYHTVKAANAADLLEYVGNAYTFSPDPFQADIERRVALMFQIFDTSHQRLVDVREVGTMVRSLDLCPTEAEVQEIIGHVEESTTKGVVKLESFVKHISFVIMEGTKYRQRTKEEMMRFFYKLDKEKKGVIDPAKIKAQICKDGEPFTFEEADEMVTFAMDKDDGLIHYEQYVDTIVAALSISIL
ncbi:unnamed protein product [Orchesella dallaii]|uniref:EF-hand calcium-binding domain-containing protein 2 n=1 Tax=Orchesella dallaii TaxID=48710 RepID=A0ABP1S5E4_9HEXA